jgi:hypothetical protein
MGPRTPPKLVRDEQFTTDVKKTGSGEKQIPEVGGHKPNKDFFLSYPLARATNPKSEDTFLIQCVKYLPPAAGEGLFLKFNENAQTAMSKGLKVDDNNKIIKNQISLFGKDAEGNPTFRMANTGMDARTEGLKKKTRFYVELPIPKQVNDGNSCIWSGNSMNLFTLAGLDLATGLMTQPIDTITNIQTILDNLVKGADLSEIGGTEEMQGAIRSSLAGLAVNQFGGNTTPNSVMSRGLGKILNENKELLFDGVNLREFKFDFTLTPRSHDEGQRAMKIIRSLKMAMAPKKGETSGAGGVLINSPDLFLLEYRSGGQKHPFLNTFKPCALTSFSVNYTGAGTYATYGVGKEESTPVHMKVAMSFKETNPIYEEDYEATGGVGY